MHTIININYGNNPNCKPICELNIGDYFLHFNKLYRLVTIEGNAATIINIDTKVKDDIVVKIWKDTVVEFVEKLEIKVG